MTFERFLIDKEKKQHKIFYFGFRNFLAGIFLTAYVGYKTRQNKIDKGMYRHTHTHTYTYRDN